jgi:hypothetical protein
VRSHVLFMSDQISHTSRLFLQNKSNAHVTRSESRYITFYFRRTTFNKEQNIVSYLARNALGKSALNILLKIWRFFVKFRVTRILKVKAFIGQEKVAKCSERITLVKCSKRSDENCQDCVYVCFCLSHISPWLFRT